MEWVLLVLIALAVPVLGVVGFFRTVSLSRRAGELEAKVAALQAILRQGGIPSAGVAMSPQSGPEPQPLAAPAPQDWTPETDAATGRPEAERDLAGAEPLEGFDAAPPEPPLAPLAPEEKARSLEEVIGTRWAVWLGGVALGLGGLFLVRYAIEEGWFGPGARIAAGALFSAALLAAGEWMRRREGRVVPAALLGGLPPAHVPSVLTAAGTLAAFATAYAAHALYDMIGPAAAFALLGLIALATMAAAALHGPALAGLGLVAALAVPLLVSSSDPRPWPVVLYLVVVVAAAYALSRLRIWLWLALSAAAGAALWGFVFVEGLQGHRIEAMTHIVLQLGLALFALAYDPHRLRPDEEADPDAPALAALAAFAGLALMMLQLGGLGPARPVFAAVVTCLLLAGAVRIAPVAGAAVLAAVVAGSALWGWPVLREAAAEGRLVLPGAPSSPPLPEAISLFLAFAAASGAALAGAGAWRLMRSPGLPWIAAGCYAVAAAVGPVALLVLAWWRVADFERSLPFGLAAAGLAVAFAGLTVALRNAAAGEGGHAARVGYEGFAAGAVGALAAGLVMVLDRGSLTVALALAAAGAAWVTTREPAGTLRYAVGALGIAVLGRLIWDPAVETDPGAWPILNWLLFGYGVPAVCFALAARLLRREADDTVVALCEGLAIAFSAFLVLFEIRHALTGSIYAASTDHLELGLQSFASLVFALVLTRIEAVRPRPVIRIAAFLFGGVGLALSLGGLLLLVNPLLSGDAVRGPAFFNTLLPAYLLPALAAFALAWQARGVRPRWFVACAAILGFVLQGLWMAMAIRHLFQGPSIGVWRRTSETELYTYSAVFLAVGLALLAVGIARRSRPLRLASAVYVFAAVAKVFLVDMSGLEGPLRALSFIGLGLALVGIGLVYQKLVFAAPPQPTPPPAAAGGA